MLSFLVPAAIAATILATPVALAAQQANGTVKAIDLNAMTLTLSDGTTYNLPQGFKDPGIKTGERVQIAWNMVDGAHDASTVTIMK